MKKRISFSQLLSLVLTALRLASLFGEPADLIARFFERIE